MNDLKNNDSHQSDGYEKEGINIKAVLVIGLSLVAFVVISIIVINEMFLASKEAMVYETVLKPESTTLREIRAREDELLNSYQLIDSANGVYRIPIDRAMELVAEEAFEKSAGK